MRVTLKFHPVCWGGVPGIELDARLGPVGLAGVFQRRRRNSSAKVDGTIGIIIEVWHDLSFFPYNSPKPWLIIYIYHSHSTHQQRRLHAAAQHAYMERCRQSRFKVRRNISSFLYMMTTKLLLLFLSCAAKAMPFQLTIPTGTQITNELPHQARFCHII